MESLCGFIFMFLISGFKKLIMLLISRGAEINAMCHSGTPLQMAADGGKKDCVKILLDNHADVSKSNICLFLFNCHFWLLFCFLISIHNSCLTTLNLLQPNAIHYRMFSPLVEAVFAHSIECVKLLLQVCVTNSA